MNFRLAMRWGVLDEILMNRFQTIMARASGPRVTA